MKKYILKKSLANAAMGVTLALKFALQQCSYQNSWIFKDLQNMISDTKIKRLIILTFSKVDMLLVDIEGLQFLDGALVDIANPDLPTELDLQELFKGLNGRQSYSSQRIKAIYESFTSLYQLLITFAEILALPEESQTDEQAQESEDMTASFRAYIIDCAYVVAMFGKALPYLFEAMFQLDIMSRPSQEEFERIGVPTLAQATQQASIDAELDLRAQAFEQTKAAPPVKKYTALERAGLLVNNELRIEIEIAKSADFDMNKAVDSRKGIFMAIVQKPATGPHEADLQKQWATAPVIEESMEEYMEKYQVLGLQHRQFHKNQGVKNPDFRLIQNFIVRNEAADGITINGKFIKNGTWVQSWKVPNPKLRKMVFDGKLTGLSLGGIGWVRETKKTPVAA